MSRCNCDTCATRDASGASGTCDTRASGTCDTCRTRYTCGTKVARDTCDTCGTPACWSKVNKYAEHLASYSKTNTSLEGIGIFKRLISLDLIRCEFLENLKGIEGLLLTYLGIMGCNKLTSMIGIESLECLRDLYLESYTPVEFPEILRLTRLTSFTLYDSNVNLTSMIEIGCMVSLIMLDLSLCRGLISLEGIKHLINLTSLTVTECKLLTCVKEIKHLSRLTDLNLSVCTALTSVNGVEYLKCLTKLDLSDCVCLHHIPSNIICLEHLQFIHVVSCVSLPPSFHICIKLLRNAKAHVFEVLADELGINTSTWIRHNHEEFGPNVNEMFVTILLRLQQIFPNFGVDPEMVEETLQQYQQCHRRDLD